MMLTPPLEYFNLKRSWMGMLAIPFVFECGYRSILPRVDIPRLCLHSTWANTVLLGRLSAFVGEWCWMMQISLALQVVLGDMTAMNIVPNSVSHRTFSFLSKCLPLICLLAECFGTTGPVTINNGWCILEAITWTTMFAIASTSALYIRRSLKDIQDVPKDVMRFANVLFLTGLVYCPYMIAINIPMYVKRYHEDEDAGVEYLSFDDGLPDIATCHETSGKWEDWKEDAGWMVGYFGPAVWTSIWLIKAPRLSLEHCYGEGEYLRERAETRGASLTVTLI